MADFAPQPQQNQDYPYINWSRPIGPVEADKSKEITLKGLATGLEGGVKIAEDFTQQNILSKEHQGLDSINDSAIERLNAAKANPNSLEEKPTPQALEHLPKTLDTLDVARANNKISQTYIDMQKDALAKSLRAQYPGHRDFIDETFSKSTREDAANKYITSLVGDINSIQQQLSSKRDETKALATRGLNEFPTSSNWGAVVAAHDAGKIPDAQFKQLYWQQSSKLSDQKQMSGQLTIDSKGMEVNEKQRKGVQTMAEDYVTQRAGTSATDAIAHSQLVGGFTPQQLYQVAQDEISGKTPLSDEQNEQHLRRLIAGKVQWEQSLRNELDAPSTSDPSSPSWTTAATVEKRDAAIKSAGKAWDDIINLYSEGEHGLAHMSATGNKNIVDDTTNKLYNDPNQAFANYTRLLSSMYKLLPAETRADFIDKGLNPSGAVNYPASINTFISGNRAARLVDDPTQSNNDGFHQPVTATLDTMAKSGLLKTPEQMAAATRDVVNEASDITNPGIPQAQRSNSAIGFFGPGNRDLLMSGRFTPQSQMTVWNELTSDKMSKEIHKLGGEAEKSYNGWVQDTFATQIIPLDTGNLKRMDNIPGVYFSWDNTNHKLDIHTDNPDVENSPEYQKAVVSKDRINAGLEPLSKVFDSTKQDINGYMYKLSKAYGANGLSQAIEWSGTPQ